MMMMLESPAGPNPALGPGPAIPPCGASAVAASPKPHPAAICFAPGTKLYHSAAEARIMTTHAIVCFHQLIEISDILCCTEQSAPGSSALFSAYLRQQDAAFTNYIIK